MGNNLFWLMSDTFCKLRISAPVDMDVLLERRLVDNWRELCEMKFCESADSGYWGRPETLGETIE